MSEKQITDTVSNIFKSRLNSSCQISYGNSQTISFRDMSTSRCNLQFSDISNEIRSVSYNNKCIDPNMDPAEIQTIVTEIREKLIEKNPSEKMNKVINENINNDSVEGITSCLMSTFNAQNIDFSNAMFDCNDDEPVDISDILNKINQNIYYNCSEKNISNILKTVKETKQQNVIIGGVVGGIIGFLLIISLIIIIVHIFHKQEIEKDFKSWPLKI